MSRKILKNKISVKLITWISLVTIILLSIACDDNKFNSKLWKEKYDTDYPHRKNIAEDLIKSKILLNLSQDSLLNILGNPQGKDTSSDGKIIRCWYYIVDYYGFDIDPKYQKSLSIEFDTVQNRISRVKIFETKDERDFIEKIFGN